ncbi:MAG: diguanylate cyclase [Myxococcales bacterium]|nr:diguanylate cyclase [Myxococcales bacterium]
MTAVFDLASPENSTAPSEDEHPPRVLIVTACRTSKRVLEASCQNLGYEVSCADETLTLRKRVNEIRPDLILLALDLNAACPQQGLEICGELKAMAQCRHTPVLLVSKEYPSARVAARALIAGADDVLSLAPSRLEEIKARIHVALRNKRYRDTLARVRAERNVIREDSHTDPLTGVLNRRALERHIRDLFDAGHQFGLLFVDVDHFKAVNDTHGHAVGDEVLKAIAARLQDGARAGDVVGRFGGEEFVVLIRGVSGPVAHSVAERHRQAVATLDLSPIKGPARVSVSVGVAAHDAEKPFDSVEAMLRRADRALYDSKRAGRNRVTIATRDSLVPPPPGGAERPTLRAIPHGNGRKTIPATPKTRAARGLER